MDGIISEFRRGIESIFINQGVFLKALVLGDGLTSLLTAITLRKMNISTHLIMRNDRNFRENHTHLLLASGFQKLVELVPEVRREFCVFDVSESIIWETNYGRLLKSKSNTTTISISYKSLKKFLMSHAERIGVLFIRSEGFNLNTTTCGTKIVSAEILLKDGEPKNMTSDIYIDATGGQTNLASLFEVEIESWAHDFWYSSVNGQLSISNRSDWTYFIKSYSTDLNYGLIARNNGSEVEVTLVGQKNHQRCPKNIEDFLSALETVGPKDIFSDFTIHSTSPSVALPLPNTIRYFSKGKTPCNLIPLGDTVGTTNPHFGRGISLACESIYTLKNRLEIEEIDELSNSISNIITKNEQSYLKAIKQIISMENTIKVDRSSIITDLGIMAACLFSKYTSRYIHNKFHNHLSGF